MSTWSYSFETRLVERLSRMQSSERAALRRSLAFPPGENIPAMRVIEAYFSEKDESRRKASYLVAGLFADLWRPLQPGEVFRDAEHSITIGVAGRHYLARKLDASKPAIERRFLTILDTEIDGLRAHLRPILRLMASDGQTWSWVRLFSDIARWDSTSGSVQLGWAKDFFRVNAGLLDKSDEITLSTTTKKD